MIIGILGHGDFPDGLLSAMTLICGQQEKVFAVGLRPEESPEGYAERVIEALRSCGDGEEVLFLVDVKGGTPCNVVARLISPKRRCIAGVNLPVLLQAVMSRGEARSAKELAAKVLDDGQGSIVDFSAELEAMMGN
ncbi:MAG TPA: PTS sugar transporter subunit IIA [Firmicutes bacterium]|nr:PTS sugar transporter subunit IIA [Candidatus Fermentithermobacillaceae bacterium]